MSSRPPSSPRSANGEPCSGNTELPVAGSPSSHTRQHGRQGKDRACMQGGGDFSSTQESKPSEGSTSRPGGDAPASNRGDYGDIGPPDSGRQIDWVPSEEVTHCNHCLSVFTVTKWKHHCRACGKVFCGECSTMRIRLPDLGYFEKVRVCDDCALSRASSHTLSLQEDLDVKEQINSNLKRALEEKTRQIEAFRSFLLQVESLGVSENSGLCLAVCAPGGQPLQHQAQAMSSQDEFASLMHQSENGLRKLVTRLQQYEDEFDDVRNQLDTLEQERAQQEARARQLEERSRSAQLEIMKLREAAAERDSLREVVEDQKRQLEESRRQVDGLKQRCVTLESKAAAISVRNSGRFRDLKSTSRGSSLPTSIGDMGSGSDETGSARLRSVVGRPSNSDEFEDLAVSFTVANGLEVLEQPRYSRMRGWWRRCCRCCPRRRRRGYISDYAPSRCVIQ